ncbi:MAG: hypothetical protein A3C06_01095 [Candidatus Taylorbacteria bacterium RIFCSPHIGHO2_02_FULL_46_13]|uniref:Thioredoxin domain-containing protein n=1 Tax=Candidatus Taylorbacteria bacterium RIFCSPHIGHO2_02_FULL_46_13 TaxID=1802312 RepID=A0A1G2MT89_9BACT|nr:MAG: hypothetical protein A3C06_01095 [Candidatus Taylorbacteria bacterium RIFCSPHIGHO2_02_FULL_46_13]
MTSLARNILLVLVIGGIIGAIVFLESGKVRPTGVNTAPTPQEENISPATASEIAMKALKYKKYIEIANPSGFVNTNDMPITIRSLVGKKVIMVDFWTYSCINCLRTLPYLTSWYAKYKNMGFEIVGIHTPEFEFEKVKDNVVKATQEYGVTYPVVQDNDYGTWHAYNNRYWPHHFLIDIDGFIVDDHIGEGAYDQTEKKIQELLAERAKRLGETVPTARDQITVRGEEVDASKPRTAEIYFGAFRNESFANGKQSTEGPQTLTIPTNPLPNLLYLGGTWNITREYSTNSTAEARILLPYSAQKVFIVASADKPLRAKVMLDGEVLPANMRGKDVDANGYVTIQENRLYRLVEDSAWGQHTLELQIESPGLDAYTFTFG